MGDFTEAFTVRALAKDVFLRTLEFWGNLGYNTKASQEPEWVILTKGRMSRNVYTFSFDKAYKQVFILFVPSEANPFVTTVQLSFSLPWLRLLKADLLSLRSLIRAFRTYLRLAIEGAPPSPDEMPGERALHR